MNPPTPTEYAHMSWHARRRLLGLAARRRPNRTEDQATRALAEQILADITPDDPLTIQQRRNVLELDAVWDPKHRSHR